MNNVSFRWHTIFSIGFLPGVTSYLPARGTPALLASTGGMTITLPATFTMLAEYTQTPTASFTPTLTPTPTFSATDVAAGRRHTCVLTDRNTVKCWGGN